MTRIRLAIVAGCCLVTLGSARRPAAAEGTAVPLERLAMHEVMHRPADHEARCEVGAQQRVAADFQAAGRCEVVGGARVVEPGDGRARGKDDDHAREPIKAKLAIRSPATAR
jgi:hypothetical protein